MKITDVECLILDHQFPFVGVYPDEGPIRICSLQPGATEIVYALGLQDQLFGVTSRCDYPADALNRPVIVHSVFDGKHPTSGEINRTIAELFGKGQKICEIDPEVLAAAAPDLLLTQAICEV